MGRSLAKTRPSFPAADRSESQFHGGNDFETLLSDDPQRHPNPAVTSVHSTADAEKGWDMSPPIKALANGGDRRFDLASGDGV